MHAFDGVAVRNSGPVLGYRREYDAFREEALREGVRVHNPLTGRADMLARQYLLDPSAEGYPVIPTVDRAEDPHPDRRRRLEPYAPTVRDLEFARRFVDRNDLAHGIQRVGACRAPTGNCSWWSWRTSTPTCRRTPSTTTDGDAFVAATARSLRRFPAG